MDGRETWDGHALIYLSLWPVWIANLDKETLIFIKTINDNTTVSVLDLQVRIAKKVQFENAKP